MNEVEQNLANWGASLSTGIPVGGLLARSDTVYKWKSLYRVWMLRELARIIHDAHGVLISLVSGSPAGCGRAGAHCGASVGSMVCMAGFGIAVEGPDWGDTARWFK